MKDEAIHKALKVLNCLNNDRVYETAWVKGAINACKEALEQPAQEPVARDSALEFYADENNWVSASNGFVLQYDPEPSAIQKDKGNIAKQALEQSKQNPSAYLVDGIAMNDIPSWCSSEVPIYSLYTHPASQPAQEPVAWIAEDLMSTTVSKNLAQRWVKYGGKAIPLYTHPRQWQELTDDEIEAIDDVTLGDYYSKKDAMDFYRAIEQALKERNHG